MHFTWLVTKIHHLIDSPFSIILFQSDDLFFLLPLFYSYPFNKINSFVDCMAHLVNLHGFSIKTAGIRDYSEFMERFGNRTSGDHCFS